MQVTRATFIPLLAAATSDRIDPGAVRDEYSADLTVVYTFGPQFGRRVVTHTDLEQLEVAPRVLRRSAFEHLEVLSSRAEFHGQPPALMLSFEGLESSLLLANDFWNRLQGAVPGELVVGVPARDVVIVTGSQSSPGLEKARRCVERVFMAGGENPLTQALLVRRGNTWEPFDRPARPGGRTSIGPSNRLGPAHQLGEGQPPRQYQEHASWPGERVAPVQQRRSAPAVGARPMPQPLAPAASLPPRPAANTLPPVPGNLGPAGPAMSNPMSVPPPNPMTGTNTGTGMQPVAVPRQRPGQGRRSQRAQQTPDVAPYSAVPYSAMPYSSVPYSAVPHSATPQSGAPQPAVPPSGRPHAGPAQSRPRSPMPHPAQSAAPYSAVPYSAVPQSAVPYSAVPQSAVPYSATPNSAAPYARPDRPTSHREADARRSRAAQPSTPRYVEEAKPAYRDDARRDERPSEGWGRDGRARERGRDERAGDDRGRDDHRGRDDRGRDDRSREVRGRVDSVREDRVREDRVREDRARDEWPRDERGRDAHAYEDRSRDDRYRDDLYSTGSHTGPLYPPAAPPTASRDGYDQQPDVPMPNYPDSWGWVPDGATPRPQQHRPLSPRDRFSR